MLYRQEKGINEINNDALEIKECLEENLHDVPSATLPKVRYRCKGAQEILYLYSSSSTWRRDFISSIVYIFVLWVTK